MKKFTFNVHYDFLATVEVYGESEEEVEAKARELASDAPVEYCDFIGMCVTDVDDFETYYQPTIYHDDGINISWDLPNGLHSFEVFKTKEECEEWLEKNGYDPLSANITQYHNDDIEEPTYVR